MNLIDVKNGHYFIRPSNPCKIYQRICDITEQYTDLQDRSAPQVRVEAKLLNDDVLYIFPEPKKTEVIGLGK